MASMRQGLPVVASSAETLVPIGFQSQATMQNSLSSAEPPRVVIFGLISQHPGRNRGGTSFSIARLARFLGRRGVRVDIVCHESAAEQPALTQLPDLVSIVPLRATGKLGITWGLYRHLRYTHPNALLALDTRANLIACRMKWLPSCVGRVFVSLRNSVTGKLGSRRSARDRRLKRTFRGLFRSADGVIAVSHGLAREFADVTGVDVSAIHVIHNLVVDDNLYAQLETRTGHPWLENKTAPVLLGVGRLQDGKDFQTLLRAFALVRRRRASRLIILGEGDSRQPLERLAEELEIAADVSMPGFVENPVAFMRCADVFVSSSRSEAFGMVLAEALAVGCPVVSTDCPSGPAEILDNGSYGVLVDVGDHEAMARAIERTLDAPPPTERLREAAQRFSVETNGQRYMDLLLPHREGSGNSP